MNNDISLLQFQRAKLRAKVDELLFLKAHTNQQLDQLAREIDRLNFHIAAASVERRPHKVQPPARRPVSIGID